MKGKMVLRALAVLLGAQSIFFGVSLYGYAAGTDTGDAGLTEADVLEQTGDGGTATGESKRETGPFGSQSEPQGASPRSEGPQLYDVGIPGALLGTDGDMYYEVTWDNGETERETGTVVTERETGAAGETKRETGTSPEGSGTCLRTIVAHGNAKGDYQVVVRITKPGVIGEAKAAISVDGGQSWPATFTVEDKVKISALGLKLEFSTERDTDEFGEGDTFRFTTVESFALISDHPEAAVVALTGHPLEKSRPTISILSSGARGVSKFALKMQDGAEPVVVDTVPKDGVYEYEGLLIYFSDSTYVKGYVFSGSIVPNEETVGMGPIAALVAVIAVVSGVGIAFMAAKKEKPGEYELRPWRERQSEEVYR